MTLLAIGLQVLDGVISMVKNIRMQAGLTTEEIAAHADAQDFQNKEDIKALLAL